MFGIDAGIAYALFWKTYTFLLPIPDGFRVDHVPYPKTNLNPIKSSGPSIASVGSSMVFLAGFAIGENMTDASSSYGSTIIWDCTQPWPTELPGRG